MFAEIKGSLHSCVRVGVHFTLVFGLVLGLVFTPLLCASRRSELVDVLAAKLLEKTTSIISVVNVSPRTDSRTSRLNTTQALRWVSACMLDGPAGGMRHVFL